MKPLAPTDLRDLFKALGWKPLEVAFADRLYVMENPEHPGRQLTYPMDSLAPDYAEAAVSVLRKLAEILRVPLIDLERRASRLHEDVLKFRLLYERAQDGLPLSFARDLLESAQKLLKSSACTVIQPRAHHPRLTLSDSVALLEHCRFEHTETGSFVMNVSCPVTALDVAGELSLDLGEEFEVQPFVRQVWLTLYDGVHGLIQAIERDTLDHLVDALKADPAPKISSNLCEALVQLQDAHLDNATDLIFDWSLSHPVPSRFRVNRLKIQRDYFPRIEEVRRELRSTEHHHEETYIGTVEKLSGVMDENGLRSGEVVLTLLPGEGESLQVRTRLNPEQYRQADKAHMTQGAFVKVTGLLRPGRQPRQLTYLKHFELLEVQPDL